MSDMKTWSSLTKLALVSALTLGLAQQTHAIVNGGFETGDFSDWTLGGVESVFNTVEAGAAHFPSSFGASFGAQNGETTLAQIVIPTTAGASYSLDFWLRNRSGSTTNSFSAWWDGVLVESLFNSPAFLYEQHTHLVVASGASTVLEFRFRHDPNFWNFDDVSVTPVGVPDGAATVSLLGIALLGLHLVRRNRR